MSREDVRRTLVFATLALLTAATTPHVQAVTCTDTTPNFTDACYHEYLLYNADATEIDVLIVPPASPYPLRDLVVIEQSVNAWEAGINALAPTWLANGLNIHAYTLGLDPVPVEALWDPEVIVVSAEYNPVLLFGIGLQQWAPCHGIGSPLMIDGVATDTIPVDQIARLQTSPGFHQHDSVWGSLGVACGGGIGNMCFAINTNFLWTPVPDNGRDMYDLVAHEFGHCLGIGHVGDALDFTAAAYPRDDIMSYESDGWDPGHVLCVSTLNIRSLERTYGYLLGQPGYPISSVGGYIHQDPALWSDYNCPEPTYNLVDLTPITTADPLGGII